MPLILPVQEPTYGSESFDPGPIENQWNLVKYVPFDLVEGETSDFIIITVTAAEGREFASGTSPIAVLKAREKNSGDPYTELADGIDMSAYPEGQNVQFEVVCEALAVSGRKRGYMFMGSRELGGAAGWRDTSSGS